MSTETVEVPAVGKVKRTHLYVGAAAVAGIVGYAWYRRGIAGASEAPEGLATDPDGVGAADYENPGDYAPAGNSTYNAPALDIIDTNAEWAQAAGRTLTEYGYDPVLVSRALGKLLARQGQTTEEADASRAAKAYQGEPPVGGPWPIITGLPTPNPSPNPAPPAAYKPPAVRKHQPTNRDPVSLRTPPGGRRTWAQLVPFFYTNPPPAGTAAAYAAGERIRHANDHRKPVKPGQPYPDGSGRWGTVGGLVVISLPQYA